LNQYKNVRIQAGLKIRRIWPALFKQNFIGRAYLILLKAAFQKVVIMKESKVIEGKNSHYEAKQNLYMLREVIFVQREVLAIHRSHFRSKKNHFKPGTTNSNCKLSTTVAILFQTPYFCTNNTLQ